MKFVFIIKNEEELTPEDFYYHDDFYQDKIKRGEEKEEP